MFCGECGAKNEKGAQFCAECGAKLEQEEKQQKEIELKQKAEQCEILKGQISELEAKIDSLLAEQREKEGRLREQQTVIDRLAKEASDLSRRGGMVECRIHSG